MRLTCVTHFLDATAAFTSTSTSASVTPLTVLQESAAISSYVIARRDMLIFGNVWL